MISHARFEWSIPAWVKSLCRRPTEGLDKNVLVWIPKTDIERRVYAALTLAGRPVTNSELAGLMRCSKSQASKDVAALKKHVQKVRIGREVRISLSLVHH